VLKKYFSFLDIFIYSSLIAVVLYLFEVFYYHVDQYYFLLWNLFLSWIPVFLVIYLKNVLKTKPWSSYEAMIISLLWVLFIPNGFYLLSDYVHLHNFVGNFLLFNIAYFSISIFTGLFLAFFSVRLIEFEIKKRFSNWWSTIIVLLIFLISSFGVYIGRDLRWNSWDIFINSGPLLLDIYHHLINLNNYPMILIIVIPFFILISCIYYLVINFMVCLNHKIIK